MDICESEDDSFGHESGHKKLFRMIKIYGLGK